MGDFMERMMELANSIHSDLVALPDDHARYDLVKQIIDSAESCSPFGQIDLRRMVSATCW